jgi:hypothetical protein
MPHTWGAYEGVFSASFQCEGLRRRPAITLGFNTASNAFSAGGLEAEWRDQLTVGVRPYAPDRMSPHWRIVSTKCLWYNGVSLESFENATEIVGESSTDNTLPPNTSVIIAKKCLDAGRKFRGRLFSPPTQLDEGSIDYAGFLGPSVITTLQAEWNGLFGQLTAYGAIPSLLHDDSVGGGSTPLTGLVVTPLVGTNRRRIR